MLLISKGMYDAFYCRRKWLVIENSDPAMFTQCSYYFRLGAVMGQGEFRPLDKAVRIGNRESLRVLSLESFKVSDRVLGIIGPCSELVLADLTLHCSPFVDPCFKGSLEFILENRSESTIEITAGMRIGKVMFFDVGETCIDLDEYIVLQEKTARLTTRLKARDMMREWVEKLYDQEGPIED